MIFTLQVLMGLLSNSKFYVYDLLINADNLKWCIFNNEFLSHTDFFYSLSYSGCYFSSSKFIQAPVFV